MPERPLVLKLPTPAQVGGVASVVVPATEKVPVPVDWRALKVVPEYQAMPERPLVLKLPTPAQVGGGSPAVWLTRANWPLLTGW